MCAERTTRESTLSTHCGDDTARRHFAGWEELCWAKTKEEKGDGTGAERARPRPKPSEDERVHAERLAEPVARHGSDLFLVACEEAFQHEESLDALARGRRVETKAQANDRTSCAPMIAELDGRGSLFPVQAMPVITAPRPTAEPSLP